MYTITWIYFCLSRNISGLSLYDQGEGLGPGYCALPPDKVLGDALGHKLVNPIDTFEPGFSRTNIDEPDTTEVGSSFF